MPLYLIYFLFYFIVIEKQDQEEISLLDPIHNNFIKEVAYVPSNQFINTYYHSGIKKRYLFLILMIRLYERRNAMLNICNTYYTVAGGYDALSKYIIDSICVDYVEKILALKEAEIVSQNATAENNIDCADTTIVIKATEHTCDVGEDDDVIYDW